MAVDLLPLSGLAAYPQCGMCGLIPPSGRRFRFLRTPRIAPEVNTRCPLGLFIGNLYWKRFSSGGRGWRNLRVEASGWFLNNQGGDKKSDAIYERSESANEDILIFFFKLDLGTRVQYALNTEQYDVAQQLRNKFTEVEAEIIKQQETKRGSSSKREAQDKALSIIRLRADLQNAVEKEDYAMASRLRDRISELEAESLSASAKALVYENTQYAFRLGQKVKHKVFGYQAVVCGMDPVCCESNSWMNVAKVEKLVRGANQPFYQILADVHEEPTLLVAYGNVYLQHHLYFGHFLCSILELAFWNLEISKSLKCCYELGIAVAEENLLAPEQPEIDRFDHPYVSFLFYGVDSMGDFIPIKQLREKFNRPRHEVPSNPPDDDA